MLHPDEEQEGVKALAALILLVGGLFAFWAIVFAAVMP